LPDITHKLVVQDREQPRSQVCSWPPQVDVFYRADDRQLNEIICGDGIVGQMQRMALEARSQRRDFKSKAGDRGF
jgi:hypothetical protein